MPRLLRPLCLLGLASLWFIPAPPAACAQSALPSAVQQILDAPEYRHSHWGLLVVDLETGESLHELNADKLFAPASVTKLYSVAAALDTLGPSHRFQTPVFRHGNVDAQGTLQGDLVLLASGDLTLGGRTLPDGSIAFTANDHTYANGSEKGQLSSPDPLAGLEDLARQVAAAGIRRIAGDVLVDDRLFDRESSTGSGPVRVSPMLVNDNLIDLTITPTQLGRPAAVAVRPATKLLRVDCRLETAPEGTPLSTTLRATGPHELVLTGKIPVGHRGVLRVHEMPDSTAYARGLFIEALDRAGVAVAASPLAGQPDNALKLTRDAYAQLPQVAVLQSPEFRHAARLCLKVSHNLHASTLPLLLAAHSGKRTLADGLGIQHDVLKRLGVEVDTISFGGGAGGSQADCVTPRATVQLLRAMHRHPAAADYRAALPSLGVDGTLAEVLPAESPAKGQVQAKTGTYFWENTLNRNYLLTSKALAGYMTTAQKRPLVFALFVNRAHIAKASDTAQAGKALARICEALYQAH
jgi:D-alanyl-D-alanine carboxypeptidase/D-alanyl-D-alanine-endopeptidase (penicillin-binding protein 4)